MAVIAGRQEIDSPWGVSFFASVPLAPRLRWTEQQLQGLSADDEMWLDGGEDPFAEDAQQQPLMLLADAHEGGAGQAADGHNAALLPRGFASSTTAMLDATSMQRPGGVLNFDPPQSRWDGRTDVMSTQSHSTVGGAYWNGEIAAPGPWEDAIADHYWDDSLMMQDQERWDAAGKEFARGASNNLGNTRWLEAREYPVVGGGGMGIGCNMCESHDGMIDIASRYCE